MLNILKILLIFSVYLSFVAGAVDVGKIKELAKSGQAIAQYNLAHYYRTGKYVAKDEKQALYWYGEAAKSKSPAVRYKIGLLHELGQLPDASLIKAFQHYLFSAESGDPYGQNNLALMYIEGKGIKKDLSEGIKWAEIAAQRHFSNAQYNLSKVYGLAGTSVYDAKKALSWLDKAVVNKHVEATYDRAKLYIRKKEFKSAYPLIEFAAEENNSNAMVMLAMMVEQGIETDRNTKKAYKILQEAANLGNKKAISLLRARSILQKQ